MTRSAGSENSTVMSRPSRSKSSSTFSSRKWRPSPRFEAQVQLQLAADPVDPLVVPDMAVDVPQVQETQPEPPGPVDIRQLNQQVGDHLVLFVALRSAAQTGLADAKRPAGQRDAVPLRCHRLLGQLPALSRRRHFFQVSREAGQPACSDRQTCASAAGSHLPAPSSG